MAHDSAAQVIHQSSHDSRDFFANLPVIGTFEEAVNPVGHHNLPGDWWVVVTDVVNSTEAIRDGRYKDVNTIGAAIIIAAINIDRSVEIPYVFGGDGSTLAVPADFQQPMRQALLATQEIARNRFGIDLRVAMIPVSDLERSGKSVRVGKFRQSAHMCLSVLSGDGWQTAEDFSKDPQRRHQYEVQRETSHAPEASFEGFECRWQNIPSRRDHKLCLLISSISQDEKNQAQTFRNIINILEKIYGSSGDNHPVSEDRLKLSFNPFRLKNEAKVRLPQMSSAKLFLYVLKSIFVNILGHLLFDMRVKTEKVDWGKYRPDFIANADFRKFDGSLKMIIDSSEVESKSLESILEDLYQRGEIFYGLHKSKEAILTCLVFSYSGNHAHFVDGADGGYALASVDLKKRRKDLTQRLSSKKPPKSISGKFGF
jgi:hypothetical protein